MRINDARGYTLVELAFLMGIMAIVTAIALPALLRARMNGNEASAVASMHAVMAAEQAYSASCVPGGFAMTLDDLALPTPGTTQGFLGIELSHNGAIKAGYIVTVSRDLLVGVVNVSSPAASCNGSLTQPASSYFVEAAPAQPGVTGLRFFAADPRNTIYTDTRVIPNPLTPGGTVIALN